VLADIRSHPAYHLGFSRGCLLGVVLTALLAAALWAATR
jgi:hypothetical protein